METGNGGDVPAVRAQSSEINDAWPQGMERNQDQVDVLLTKLVELKACLHLSEDDTTNKELDILWRIVKMTATLLTYLKSKAKIMAALNLAMASCGINELDGVGFLDGYGTPFSDWMRSLDLSSFDGPNEETWVGINRYQGCIDEQDGEYIGEVFKSVQMVSDVMETLMKRVIAADSEAAVDKEKIMLSQLEIKKKAVQLESMALKLEDMERFALGTNTTLSEMRERIDDLVEETIRQRQRATENEQELNRVKQDFESLKSYVGGLIYVRETLISSEQQFQTIERLFERLTEKTSKLEGEKKQKEAEVKRLTDDNDRLSTLLDKKDAQLLALNEQCKFMALNTSRF